METITYNSRDNILTSGAFKQVEQSNRGYFISEDIERILFGCKLNRRAEQKELYAEFFDYAMSISLRYSSNDEDALEIVNDAFLKIFKNLKSFAPRNCNTASTFTAWSLSFFINCAAFAGPSKFYFLHFGNTFPIAAT